MATKGTVVVGPWGGRGGSPWSYIAIGAISRISVTYDDSAIHSIRFMSRDDQGYSEESPVYGGPNGPYSKQIDIETTTDRLLSLQGSVGMYNSVKTVTSLSFTSKNGTSKTFGHETKGNEFKVLLPNDQFSGFVGSAGALLNSIGLSVDIKTQEIIGPWGNHPSGSGWFYTADDLISRIYITYDDDAIHSLQFTSKDVDGNLVDSKRYGTKYFISEDREIDLEHNAEKLIGISGTYGAYHGKIVVTSLTFITDNHKQYGPFGFGRDGCTPFSYVAQGDDQYVTGFHGYVDDYIEAIGVCMQPSKTNMTAQVGALGGLGGTPWRVHDPIGLISRIFLTHNGPSNGTVHSIRFQSVDKNGVVHTSLTYGEETGQREYKIDVEAGEKLTNVSGTISTWNETPLVSSLSFSTNKDIVYGPFGNTEGIYFSFPIKNGVIAGFHGRAGRWLDSFIGLFIKPAN